MIEPIIVARAIHIAATLWAAGTTAFVVLVAEPSCAKQDRKRLAEFRSRSNVMIWTALAVAVASGFVWLALVAADISGGTVTSVSLHGGFWPVLTGTRFGIVWLCRLVLALLLMLLLLLPLTRHLQLLLAAALAATLALVGHAGATPGPAGDLHLVSDIAHLLAACCWLGALPALAMFLLSRQRVTGVHTRAVQRFSVLAIISVAILATTGLINSWALVGVPRDLWTTSYGRALALKLGLFAAMLGIAAVNRFYLTPRLVQPGSSRALVRNTLAEVALGLGILLLVGALGTLPPTKHAALLEPASEEAAFVHVHTTDAMADVTVTPGRAGLADATIRLSRDDSSEFPADTVVFAAELPGQAAPSINRAALRQDDGNWHVQRINFGQPGNWTVRIIVSQQDGPSLVLDAPIVIKEK